MNMYNKWSSDFKAIKPYKDSTGTWSKAEFTSNLTLVIWPLFSPYTDWVIEEILDTVNGNRRVEKCHVLVNLCFQVGYTEMQNHIEKQDVLQFYYT